MKIIRVKSQLTRDYESNNQFILLAMDPEYSYYLVNHDTMGYEVVESVPCLNEIVQGTMEGIIKHVSYLSNEKIRYEIMQLQEKLNASDYKVLKSYEYALVGKINPYNMSEIHIERQNIRDKINILESQIKEVKTWDELSNIVMDNRK